MRVNSKLRALKDRLDQARLAAIVSDYLDEGGAYRLLLLTSLSSGNLRESKFRLALAKHLLRW